MKIEYHYKGFWNFDSKCGLEIKRDNDKVIVILTELEDNPGTSVTNMVEHLATMVYHQFLAGTPVENITWIEHYPERSFKSSSFKEIFGETFDEVSLSWDGKTFKHPKWKRISGRRFGKRRGEG